MSENKYENCFVCGKENPIGLKLDFQYTEDSAFCIWTAHKNFEGYPDIIHGGILSTLMDEVMAKAILKQNRKAVTIEITIKFLKSAYSGQSYKICGKIIKDLRRVIECEAFITEINDESNIIAQANAVFFQVKSEN